MTSVPYLCLLFSLGRSVCPQRAWFNMQYAARKSACLELKLVLLVCTKRESDSTCIASRQICEIQIEKMQTSERKVTE